MTSLDLVDFAVSAAVFGLASLTAALALAGARTRARLYLAAFFGCLALEYLIGTVVVGLGEDPPAAALRWLHVFNVPVAYLLGPLLYGYAAALTSPPAPTSPRRMTIHALPALAALVFSLANALFVLDRTLAGRFAFLLTYHAWVLQGAIYFALAAWQTSRARARLEHVSADETALQLAWLRWLALIMEIGWLLAAGDRFPMLAKMHAWNGVATAIDVLMSIALYCLAWFGLRQHILRPATLAAAPADDDGPSAAPYARSGLDDAHCREIAQELRLRMIDDRLYADSGLDLQTLSRHTGWSPNTISQALNQGLGQNFFEFVNHFRVDAARRCLADAQDRRTVLDIALACGFGSKSTFNTVFKRMTGVTPRELRLRARSEKAGPAA